MAKRGSMLVLGLLVVAGFGASARADTPNVVLIYADDIGYGDLGATAPRPSRRRTSTGSLPAGCGSPTPTRRRRPARRPATPADRRVRLAQAGHRRPARRRRVDHRAGPARRCRPCFKGAGYTTGVVGKWHLGLGAGDVDWNGEIKPGPLEIGFDYAFLIPATGDRVPCVYVENRRVVGLDPSDPIRVSYKEPVGNEPTGKDEPRAAEDAAQPRPRPDDRQRHQPHRLHERRQGGALGGRGHGRHDHGARRSRSSSGTGSSRSSCTSPRTTSTCRACRTRGSRGRSGMGPRGDAILEFDWCVGEILETLDRLKLTEQHARDLDQRQRPGRRRRLPGPGRREARGAHARRAPARRQVQHLRRRHARAVHRPLARAREAGRLGRARRPGRPVRVVREPDRTRPRGRRPRRTAATSCRRCSGRHRRGASGW